MLRLPRKRALTRCPTQFARCHHLTQPYNEHVQSAAPATQHAHVTWARPKCRTCDEKCKSSSANLSKLLCVSHKTTFGTLRSTSNCVTECHACHAKRHYNFFWKLQTWTVLQLSPQARQHKNKTREPRRDTVRSSQRAFRTRRLQLFMFRSYKMSSHELQNLLPQNRCFVQGFRQFSSRANCAWTRPKCCTCHEKCKSSSENLSKVLCLSHKTTFDTLSGSWECHEVPHVPQTALHNASNLQKSFATRTVADGCGRLRTAKQSWANAAPPPDLQSKTRTPPRAFGNKIPFNTSYTFSYIFALGTSWNFMNDLIKLPKLIWC